MTRAAIGGRGLALASAIVLAVLLAACDSGSDSAPQPAPPGGGVMQSAGGEPVLGYPNWQERVLLVLSNALRMAPVGYRDGYTGLTGVLAGYTAQVPLRWRLELNQAARFHAEDMAVNGCFTHDDCNGLRSAFQRIADFYPGASLPLEVQALTSGAGTALQVMELLICDGSPPTCPADFTTDPHRAILMGYNTLTSSYLPLREGGGGYAASASAYWVIDYANNTPVSTPPIVSGTHHPLSGQLAFLVNYHDPAGAPQAVRLVLEGVPEDIALDIGTPAAGTYRVLKPLPGACQSYHFEAVDYLGGQWRYPGTGELRTYDGTTCTEDYLAP